MSSALNLTPRPDDDEVLTLDELARLLKVPRTTAYDALRSTDPRGLAAVDDPIGARNDEVLAQAAAEHSFICAGWGAHGSYLGRAAAVLDLVRRHRSIVHCLGVTNSGEPRHPLYLPRVLAPVPLDDAIWAAKTAAGWKPSDEAEEESTGGPHHDARRVTPGTSSPSPTPGDGGVR